MLVALCEHGIVVCKKGVMVALENSLEYLNLGAPLLSIMESFEQ